MGVISEVCNFIKKDLSVHLMIDFGDEFGTEEHTLTLDKYVSTGTAPKGSWVLLSKIPLGTVQEGDAIENPLGGRRVGRPATKRSISAAGGPLNQTPSTRKKARKRAQADPADPSTPNK